MYTLSLTAAALLAPGLAAGPAAAPPPSYSKQVKPLLTRYCVECHNAREPEGDLVLESYKSLMEGGRHGAAVVPGKPDVSRLVRMVEGKLKPFMPPRKAKQPTPAEVAVLRAWVAAGARDDGAAVRVVLPAIAPRTKLGTPVAALAYDPAGKVLAASGRGEVLFLDVAGGELKAKLGGQRDRVTALAFGAGGKRLAVASSTAGEGHDVRLYDFRAGQPGSGAVATRHDDVIHALAFNPEGKLLASCGYDRVIKLWDVSTGKELRVLRDHSDAVYALAFSPDGKLLASASADRAVKVWDVLTGNRLYTLGESTDWVYAVAWSPDGRHLAAAGVDRSIRVWEVDARGGRVVHSVFAHEGAVTRLLYSADGKTLYSLGEDRVVKAWDAARMVERRVYARQPEAPLALALRPDQRQLAVGRFDGALVLLDAATGKVVGQPLPLKPRPPVLSALTPAFGPRGRPLTLRLQGKHLLGAEVVAPTLGKAVVLPGGRDEAIEVRLTVPPTTPAGNHTLAVKTPAGQSAARTFTVDLFDAVREAEPNDSPRTGQKVTLPATLVGEAGRAGDVDYFRFEAKAGQEVGVQALTAALGSRLEPLLRLVDPDGNVVAESTNGLLGHTCARAGTYSLGVRDRDFRGGPGMGYRLHVGEVPVVTSVFPLGVQRGRETEVRLEGTHLGKARSVRLKVPADAAVGSRVPVPFTTPAGAPLGAPSVVVGEFPEVAGKAGTLAVPGTANGTIDGPGVTGLWRFRARKGERFLLEVSAARLGSPLDSYIEVLDAKGRPLPRATLRCLAKTFTTFRDVDSRSPGIRIEAWGELAVNDYLLVGSELVRIRELPRNPDDDCQFFREAGQRLAYLGTTPTFHSQGQPMYKVSVHPPGTTFPPNGLPVVTLFWRNDDGGPGFGKDSRLVFDPPADGEYQVRIGDSRGEGSRAHAYRLTVRPPRPDFTINFSPTAPAVSKGAAVPVRVTVRRSDEFDGPIEVRLLNLPPGFSAPVATVPAGENNTALALYAAPSAAVPAKAAPLELEAKATIGGKAVVRKAAGGAPRVLAPGDLVTTTEQSEVTVRPGGEVRVTVKVERRNGFKGRVPVDVLGLPHGVRVLDVGLNGILITEAETARTFVVYAEPWVAPARLPFVVVARREGKGTEHAAKAVLLRVEKGK
jgi:WD40 repeat protein